MEIFRIFCVNFVFILGISVSIALYKRNGQTLEFYTDILRSRRFRRFQFEKGIRQNMMRTNVQMFPHTENF